jgi:hypothetical protein
VDIPEAFVLRSLRYYKNYILLGGDYIYNNLFYVLNVNNKKFSEIQVPLSIYFPGKSIDGFLFTEEEIIAIDNIVMPKYLISYKLSELPNLKTKEIFELESNGTYESIQIGVNTQAYIGLLSTTFGGYPTSTADHITILKTNNYEDGFSISSKKAKDWSYLEWTDIEIIGEKVYVACCEKGLGSFKIKDRYFQNITPKWDDPHNKEIGKGRIKYYLSSPKKITMLCKTKDNRLILVYKDENDNYHVEIKN